MTENLFNRMGSGESAQKLNADETDSKINLQLIRADMEEECIRLVNPGLTKATRFCVVNLNEQFYEYSVSSSR